MQRILLLFTFILFVLPELSFAGNPIFFDVNNRREVLHSSGYEEILNDCMAENTSLPSLAASPPVLKLEPTEDYGSDHSANDFTKYIMFHGGRALAGNAASHDLLSKSILSWAEAKALEASVESYDTYYAIKRFLLPTIINYAIVEETYTEDQKAIIHGWLDRLVRRMDATFGGDVDHNNHRYLADSVLMAWGAFIGDKKLYQKGTDRFKIVLSQMNQMGGLPLENRRGARALWYLRQTLADLTVMAEIAAVHGDNLYGEKVDSATFNDLLSFYLAALHNELLILPDAAENYIPGPSHNFFEQDRGMLTARGGRHYMAFTEAYEARFGDKGFVPVRLHRLMMETGFKERPLIDEYVGGNASCFWRKPSL